MQQNYFVLPTKHCAKSMKFWLFKENFSLGQQTNFLVHTYFFQCIYKFFVNFSGNEKRKTHVSRPEKNFRRFLYSLNLNQSNFH